MNRCAFLFQNLCTANLRQICPIFVTLKKIHILLCISLTAITGTLAGKATEFDISPVRYELEAVATPDSARIYGVLRIFYTNFSSDTLRSLLFVTKNGTYERMHLPARNELPILLKKGFHDTLNTYSFYTAGGRETGVELTGSIPQIDQEAISVQLSVRLLPGDSINLVCSFNCRVDKITGLKNRETGIWDLTGNLPLVAAGPYSSLNLPGENTGGYPETAVSFQASVQTPSIYNLIANADTIEFTDWKQSKHFEFQCVRNSIPEILLTTGLTRVYCHSKQYSYTSSGTRRVVRIHFPFSLSGQADTMLHHAARILEIAGSYTGIAPPRTYNIVIIPGASRTLSGTGLTVPEGTDLESLTDAIANSFIENTVNNDPDRHAWMHLSLNAFLADLYESAVHLDRKTCRGMALRNPVNRSGSTGYIRTKHRSELAAYRVLSAEYERRPVTAPYSHIQPWLADPLYKGLGREYFMMLYTYVGDSLFRESIRCYAQNRNHPVPQYMKQCFEKVSNLDLKWFFDTLIESGKPGNMPHGWENRSGYDHPAVDCFIPSRMYLGKKSGNSKITAGLPFGVPLRPGNMHIDILPFAGYNLYDGLYPGLYLGSRGYKDRFWQLKLAPAYSGTTKRMIGSALLSHTVKGSEGIRTITGIGISSFSLMVQSELNTYYRLHPFLIIHLPQTGQKVEEYEKSISLEYTRTGLNKTYQKLGDSVSIPLPSSYFFHYARLGYLLDNHAAINRFRVKVQAELAANHRFDPGNDSYLKTWMELTYRYKYAEGRKYFRISWFGGYFISEKGNTDRQRFYLSYNGGFTDYDYREPMFGRSELSSGNMLAGKQVLDVNGNMRNVIPLGPAGRWMTSANFDISLPGILPVGLYTDLGFYSERIIRITTQGRAVVHEAPELIYSAGINLIIKNGLLEIFMPLGHSEKFNNYNVSNYYRHYNRIGFKLRLNRLEPDRMLYARCRYGSWFDNDEI